MSLSRVRSFRNVLVLTLVLIVVGGCSDPIHEIHGTVMNLYGEPLRGAVVNVAGNDAPTTGSGAFLLKNLDLIEGLHPVRVLSGEVELFSDEMPLEADSVLSIYVKDDDNLVPNPGFELGVHDDGTPVLWDGSAENFISVVEDPVTGKYAGALYHPPQRNSIHIRADAPAKPGERFYARAMVKNSHGELVVVYIRFIDANGDTIGNLGTSRGVRSKEWQLVETDPVTAPEGTAQVRVMFWQGAANRETTAYYDDVYLGRIVE